MPEHREESAAEPSGDARLDCVLIYPPWPAISGRAILISNLPPLGVLSIAAHVESQGFSVQVYDAHSEEMDETELRARLRTHRPRLVGLSVLTSQCPAAHKIARICKEELPECTVVAGGVHAEAMPERMLRNSAIDGVVRGDGEDAMVELLQGRAFQEVAGMTWREGARVKHGLMRPVEMDLDRYPMPAYHLVDFEDYYPGATTYRRLPAINLLMTRGCPGRCTFCNSAQTTLRARTAASMVEQVVHLYEHHGIRQFQFYDDTFTVLKKNCLEFCRLLSAEKLDIAWIAFVRGDCFNETLAQAMAEAGCHQVLIGVETGSPEIGVRIGKTIQVDRYKKAVEIAHRFGLEVRASFVIGSPGDTWDTMQASLDLAIELDVDFFQLFINTPYPGTAFFREALEEGWLVHQDWVRYGQAEVIVEQPQLGAEEIYRFERYANRRFYLRPRAIFRLLKRIFHWQHLRDYFLAVAFVILGMRKDRHAGKWDCWRDLKEEDFLDLALDEPGTPRISSRVRQEGIQVAG